MVEPQPCPHCRGEAFEGSACPRSIRCPRCDAAPGHPCRRPSDHRAATMHAARWQLAEQMDAAAGVTYDGAPAEPGQPGAALGLLDATIAALPTRGHPRASLHAVYRKVERLARYS